MSRVLCVLMLFAGLAAGAGAQAQPSGRAAAAPSPDAVAGVTVVGRKPVDEAMIRTVIAPFVEEHAARDRKSGLLVREPPSGVCPVVLGLPAAFDAFVAARIVAVAKTVGAAVQPAGRCRPNVDVLFTTQPQVLVDALAKRTQGAILGFYFVGEKSALAHVSHPIQAWYVTGTTSDMSMTGARLIDRDGGQTSTRTRAVVDRADGPAPFSGTGSHIPPMNSSQIMNVLVVVDAGKLGGHEIGPISDYIAMLSLSQARSLDACGKLPSILDLMAGDCPDRPKPRALTDSDLAFLKALYAADITTSGTQARDKVEHGMASDLRGATP